MNESKGDNEKSFHVNMGKFVIKDDYIYSSRKSSIANLSPNNS